MVNVNKLKAAMVREGYTQPRFAEALKMSINTLNAKVNGKTKISTDEAKLMCKVLNIKDDVEKVDIFLA